MRILITGGAGFIGSNLARHLAKNGQHELRVLDDLSTGSLANLNKIGVEFVQGSVVDAKTVAEVVDGVDAVVHLAALGSVPRSIKDPVGSHEANLTGTLNVLEAARQRHAYTVFASSSSVYGANPKLPKSENDWTRPLSPYAVTKLGAECYVIAYQYSYGLPSLAFRFFNVYGPNQSASHAYAAVIPRFLAAARSGKPLTVHGDGLQSRDFTYVDTVCDVLANAVENRIVSPDPVNLAFGTNTTLLELIGVIEESLQLDLEIEHVEPREGDVRASQADNAALLALFPDVKPIGLRDGMRATAAWFEEGRAKP